MPESRKVVRVIHVRHAPAGWRSSPRYEYIGRGSKWGNDYSHLHGSRAHYRVGTREDAIALFKEHQLPGLLPHIGELDGKILVCFCYPEACHGSVLIKALDELKENETCPR